MVCESLKCIYTNIDGLNAIKAAEIEVMVSKEKPHIIFLTETKMCSDLTSSQFFDTGSFTVFRWDRGTG